MVELYEKTTVNLSMMFNKRPKNGFNISAITGKTNAFSYRESDPCSFHATDLDLHSYNVIANFFNSSEWEASTTARFWLADTVPTELNQEERLQYGSPKAPNLLNKDFFHTWQDIDIRLDFDAGGLHIYIHPTTHLPPPWMYVTELQRVHDALFT